jgi:hypothetical protein
MIRPYQKQGSAPESLVLTPDRGSAIEKGLVVAVFMERAEHSSEVARHWAQNFILENQDLLLPYLR